MQRPALRPCANDTGILGANRDHGSQTQRFFRGEVKGRAVLYREVRVESLPVIVEVFSHLLTVNRRNTERLWWEQQTVLFAVEVVKRPVRRGCARGEV